MDLVGGLAAFLAAGLPWTASYGAPYAPGDPSFSEQWAFYNDGTFSIEEEKNRYAVYDDPFGQPWAPGDWHFEEPEILGMLVQVERIRAAAGIDVGWPMPGLLRRGKAGRGGGRHRYRSGYFP